MNKKANEAKKTVGELEIMAAAMEPGVVITEEMSLVGIASLLTAASIIRTQLILNEE